MLGDRSSLNLNQVSLNGSLFKAKDDIVVVEHRISSEASFNADPLVLNTDYNSESDSCELLLENLTDDFTAANPITVSFKGPKELSDDIHSWSDKRTRSGQHQTSVKSNKVLESIVSNLNYLNINI